MPCIIRSHIRRMTMWTGFLPIRAAPKRKRTTSYSMVLKWAAEVSVSMRESFRRKCSRRWVCPGKRLRKNSVSFWKLSATERLLTGGMAYGLDRLVMLMLGESSIREVIAFPKNQNAQCLMSEAPGEISEEQLEELSIRIVPEQE